MQNLFQSLGVIPPAWRLPLFLCAALALTMGMVGTWARIRIWGLGRRDRNDVLGPPNTVRLMWLSLARLFSADCLFARRVFAHSRWRGWMVVAFIWSSLVLLAAVLVSGAFFVVRRAIPPALDRLASPLLDFAGLVLLLGLLAALVRRYLIPPERWITVSSDGFMLLIFVVTVLSGLALEAIRLTGSGWEAASRWPVGSVLAQTFYSTRLPPDVWVRLYLAAYLIHAGSGLGLAAYLPFSKLIHLMAAQLTTFAASQRSRRGRPGRRVMAHEEAN